MSFRAILPHEEYEDYAAARRAYELAERAREAATPPVNSPKARMLIRSVENILWNYTHSGGAVTPKDVADGLLRAYTDSYGVLPVGTNREK